MSAPRPKRAPRKPRDATTRLSLRGLAISVLVRVEDGAFANLALPAALRARDDLDPRDRGFVTELVYGTLRELRALDYRLEPFVARGMASLDPPVRAALRVGTYQLVHGVAPHAAVGETVEAVPARARGFVNAILRNVTRQPRELPDDGTIEAAAIRTSMPDWIAGQLRHDFGTETAITILEASSRAPDLTLRTTDPDTVRAELEAEGATVTPGRLVTTALRVRAGGDPKQLAAVADGRATPQDEASQAVALAVGVRRGDRVLDACAAPGGKSLAMAAAGASVVAADVDPGRVRTMRRNAARAGVEIATIVADARRLPLHETFDRVLVDAPCSGIGVLRRRPDARWRLQPEALVELAALQREILDAAARHVRPGGVLVYAVCTITSPETLEIDDWMRDTHPEFVALTPPAAPWQPHGRGAVLLPQAAETDGMYVLVLERGAARVDADDRALVHPG